MSSTMRTRTRGSKLLLGVALLILALRATRSGRQDVRRPARHHTPPPEPPTEQSAPTTEQIATRYAPRNWAHARFEPYKIAIGAFYALCVQRAFDTAISQLSRRPISLSIHSHFPHAKISTDNAILIFQLVAFLVWLGLYYVNNVRTYLLVPEDSVLRRVFTHIVLTAAFGFFYFLAATLGQPSDTQIAIILGILLGDIFFPLALGNVLSVRQRWIWVGRGLLQFAAMAAILVLVAPASLERMFWSALWTALMLVQLLVLAPWESRQQRRRFESGGLSPATEGIPLVLGPIAAGPAAQDGP